LGKGQYLSSIPPPFLANEEKIAVFKETPDPDRKGVRLIIKRPWFFHPQGGFARGEPGMGNRKGSSLFIPPHAAIPEAWRQKIGNQS